MLSLIILAYNDGKSLQENIPAWVQSLESISNDFELVIADDASLDNTNEVAQMLSSKFSQVKYFRSVSNKGVGANFRMGVENASGDYIAYTDGDGQYLPTDLVKLWQHMDGSDMITGKRKKRADPFKRTITSRMYNFLVRCIYPVKIHDINSGLKIYSRNYLNLCSPQFSNGPFFDAEYVIKGVTHGMKIREIPIEHRKRKYGKAAGVSRRSIQFLFSEICKAEMSPYAKKNYLARLMFKLLTIQASFPLSIS